MKIALRQFSLRCMGPVFCLVIPAAVSCAQQVATLPDAPVTQQAPAGAATVAPGVPAATATSDGHQTKRILFIVPNFRSVSADQKLPPQTVREKFKTTLSDSVDYSSFIFVAGQAGFAQLHSGTPEFGTGPAAYGRYYWHTYADYVDENLWTEFILPSVLHQDSRYYTLSRGTFAKRLGYSFSRVAITRSDRGHNTFNASEIVGAGIASGISSTYYPSQERTASKTIDLWLTNLGIDGGTFIFKEFWPDLNNRFFHQKD